MNNKMCEYSVRKVSGKKHPENAANQSTETKQI
jgi:hypothetical protein